MERVHKANLLVILACVLALSVTTIMSYGMSAKSIKGCGVLVATLVIVAVANFLKISDFAKALVIVLCPSYAVLIYSGLVNGNRIAFLANFITLSMAARYFDNKNLFICSKCSAFISWDKIWGEKDKAGRSGTLPGAGKYSSCQPDCF